MFLLLVVILGAAFVRLFRVCVHTEKVRYNSLNTYCFMQLKLSYSLMILWSLNYYSYIHLITVIHI